MKEQPQPPRRVFVGVKVPAEAAEELVLLQSRLSGLEAKLVPKEDFHITLVPPWEERMVEGASQILREALADVPTVSSALQKLSYGPDKLRPRLVWAVCECREELVELRKRVQKAFGAREHAPFLPHVTVARFHGADKMAPRRVPLDIPLAVPLPIERVQMFESPAPEGGKSYSVLYDFRLRAPNGPPR